MHPWSILYITWWRFLHNLNLTICMWTNVTLKIWKFCRFDPCSWCFAPSSATIYANCGIWNMTRVQATNKQTKETSVTLTTQTFLIKMKGDVAFFTGAMKIFFFSFPSFFQKNVKDETTDFGIWKDAFNSLSFQNCWAWT